MSLNYLKNTIREIKDISVKESNNNATYLKKIIKNIKIEILKKKNPLKLKIEKIKKSYISNWESNNMAKINSITNIISFKDGIPLPVLTICGKGTREIRFTEYLAFFLNPNNAHGIQSNLLKILLDDICKEHGLSKNWYDNCLVKSELNLGEIIDSNNKITSYVDIGIIGNEFLIVIEHKILSSESDHPDSDLKQLERYNIALNNDKFKDKRKIKVFLTPEKKENINSNDWIQITHKEIISKGIKLLNDDDLTTTAKENLLRFLLDLSIGPYEKSHNSLETLVDLGNLLKDDGFNLLRALKFKKLLNQNELTIKLILEG